MALYDDISDDSIAVDISKLPVYFYIIQSDEKDIVPDYVFTDFKKFYDIFYLLISNEENQQKVIPGRLPIKDGFLSSKIPFLKMLLNCEQESDEYHQKLFTGHYRPSDTFVEEGLMHVENKIFEDFD